MSAKDLLRNILLAAPGPSVSSRVIFQVVFPKILEISADLYGALLPRSDCPYPYHLWSGPES